jgi:hypothetical protein
MAFLDQPQPLPVPVINQGGCYSMIKGLLFSPLRFCGRQWVWINSYDNNQISQVVLKVLVISATLLSSLPAIIGALVFSADDIPDVTKLRPGGNINLLEKGTSDEAIAEIIRNQLRSAGYEYSVEVRSLDREVINHYYPNHIHRYVILTDSSSTAITRFWEVLKNHFYNNDISSLDSLYPCIYNGSAREGWTQLKDVLALHKSVTFSMAFDLAYVRTELGRGI